jgi:hypothetical protein
MAQGRAKEFRMAKFIKVPPLKIMGDGRWQLADILIYESDLTILQIVILEGFETDLASIPSWVPEFLIPRNGRHRAAAIVHDYLCRNPTLEERSLADKIFLEAMKVDGVPAWRRYAMYYAVRSVTLYCMIKRKMK